MLFFVASCVRLVRFIVSTLENRPNALESVRVCHKIITYLLKNWTSKINKLRSNFDESSSNMILMHWMVRTYGYSCWNDDASNVAHEKKYRCKQNNSRYHPKWWWKWTCLVSINILLSPNKKKSLFPLTYVRRFFWQMCKCLHIFACFLFCLSLSHPHWVS